MKRYKQEVCKTSGRARFYRKVVSARALLAAVIAAPILVALICLLAKDKPKPQPVLKDWATTPTFSASLSPRQLKEAFVASQDALENASLVRETLAKKLKDVELDYNLGRNLRSEGKLIEAMSAVVTEAQKHDPYAMLMTIDQYNTYVATTSGKQISVALTLSFITQPANKITISNVTEGSSAQKAGLLADDELVSLEGFHVSELFKRRSPIGDIYSMLNSGTLGSKVKMEIKRGNVSYKLEVEREITDIKPAIESKWFSENEYHKTDTAEPEIGQIPVDFLGAFLKILHFGDDNFSVAFEQQLNNLVHAKTDGIVLGLQDVSGGDPDKAIRVAALFMENGVIAYQIHPNDEGDLVIYTYFVKNSKVYFKQSGPFAKRSDGSFDTKSKPKDIVIVLDWPAGIFKGEIVVTINENTKGAAEIIAAALKKNERAQLVGPARTAGKGQAQTAFFLDDKHVLVCTTSFYLQPDGWAIDKIGIRPTSQSGYNLDWIAPKLLSERMQVVPLPELPESMKHRK